MNLFLVTFSFILILSADVLSLPTNINIDSDLQDLVNVLPSNGKDLSQHVDNDPIMTTEIWCDEVVQGYINILTDSDSDLTPEQLRMIPKLNKNKQSRRQPLPKCLEEYSEWFTDIGYLEDASTPDQRRKIGIKVASFFEQLLGNSGQL